MPKRKNIRPQGNLFAPLAEPSTKDQATTTPPPQSEKELENLMANLMSPTGNTLPQKRQREVSPSVAGNTPNDSPMGKLESRITGAAQKRATEFAAEAEAIRTIAAALDIAVASLKGLAKAKGKKITHQLTRG